MKTDLFLSKLLSIKFLAFGWLAVNSVKFYLYNIAGWGLVWNIKPTFMNYFDSYMELVTSWWMLGFLAAAFILDKYLWPYVFQKETKELLELMQSEDV